MYVWRLKRQNQQSEGTVEGPLELVHEETLPLSPFLCFQSFISEKYIVSEFLRRLDFLRDFHEVMIEVRSAVNFAIIHTFEKQILPLASDCFRFMNNILVISVATRLDQTTKVR